MSGIDVVGQSVGGRVVDDVSDHAGDPAGVAGRQGGHRRVQHVLFYVGHHHGGTGLQ